MKRLLSLGAAALAALLCAQMLAVPLARAQAYPARLVKVVVPFPPGGSGDILGRAVAQRLSDAWGQPVVVENRPGAGGTIGAEYVAKAAADGYTLLLADHGAYVITPHLYSKLNYNPLSDFAPITDVFYTSTVLAVSNDLPARDFREFVAYAKANPGKLSYGSFGYGSISHVAIEKLKQLTGIDVVHVPYKGGAPAMTDLITGRVALLMGNYAFWEPNRKAGKLKVIAAATEKRLAVRPDLPTISESGVPGYSVNIWYGLAAPARTPAPALDRVHADVLKILRDPEFGEKFMKAETLEPGGSSREEFTALLRAEYARWGQLVRESGAKVD